MDTQTMLVYLAKASYFLAAVLFILGIKRMSSPVTAKKGIVQAGIGMVVATLATFAITGGNNLVLIVLGIAIGVVPTWLWGKKVAMTDMPQMVALFNGMGGGSAAAIGAGELLKFTSGAETPPLATLALAVVGALIGSISMTGSIIAWAKLDGRMDKRFTFAGQTPTQPEEVWSYHDGHAIAVTDTNPQVREWKLGTEREISWKNSHDGKVIHGVVDLPPGYKTGTRTKTIVHVHGGPEDQQQAAREALAVH